MFFISSSVARMRELEEEIMEEREGERGRKRKRKRQSWLQANSESEPNQGLAPRPLFGPCSLPMVLRTGSQMSVLT